VTANTTPQGSNVLKETTDARAVALRIVPFFEWLCYFVFSFLRPQSMWVSQYSPDGQGSPHVAPTTRLLVLAGGVSFVSHFMRHVPRQP